jgi:hypothetical protein
MSTTHTNSQPSSQPSFHGARDTSIPKPPSSVPTSTTRPSQISGDIATTKAPWLSGPTHRTTPGASLPGPTTSWTGQSGAPGMPATKAAWASAGAPAGGTDMPTRFPAPSAGTSRGPPSSGTGIPTRFPAPSARGQGTAAPWARNAPQGSSKKGPEFREEDEKTPPAG